MLKITGQFIFFPPIPLYLLLFRWNTYNWGWFSICGSNGF